MFPKTKTNEISEFRKVFDVAQELSSHANLKEWCCLDKNGREWLARSYRQTG